MQIIDRVRALEGDIRPILLLQYRTDAKNDPYRIYTIMGILGAVVMTTHMIGLVLISFPIWGLAGYLSLPTAGIVSLIGCSWLYLSTRVAPLSITREVLKGESIAMSTLKAMMQTFYRPILHYAEKHRLPALDLPNSLNFHKPLYECRAI